MEVSPRFRVTECDISKLRKILKLADLDPVEVARAMR